MRDEVNDDSIFVGSRIVIDSAKEANQQVAETQPNLATIME